ncbi:MAG: hypothetical protein GSR73_02680 [Desulfurococcales archaeon]|nr:hypothetical protein [Desulfurococcales archaeon]
MYGGMILPNIEAKIAKTGVHRYAIANHVKVIVNDEHTLRISPIELQIAYKLYLGTDKDVGDAIFLYNIFRDAINHGELLEWCNKLRADCSLLRGEEP